MNLSFMIFDRGIFTEKTGVGTISDLMQQLRYNVYTKKSKNVEILHLAAEVCENLAIS
jgi:hypothetical protein